MKRNFQSIHMTILLMALIVASRASGQTITTIAGGGVGDGKPATEAFVAASSLAFDPEGNIVIADTGHHRIRQIDSQTGVITTIAGTGAFGYNGDNIPAIAAALAFPKGLTFDRAGNLYFCDSGNFRVRKIDAETGQITTVAGNGNHADTVPGIPAVERSSGLLRRWRTSLINFP